LQSWQVMPGKLEQKGGRGELIQMDRITPQAPWRKNCMKKSEVDKAAD